MYYYFSASLPELKPGVPPPLALTEFDAEARMHLSACHYAQLVSEPDDDAESPAPLPRVYREMRKFEEYLRTRIARRRAEKLDLSADFPEPEEYFSEVDSALPSLAALDPAERERGLDMLRWKKLDELAQNHDFDFDHVCAYRARLRIAEKYRGRDAAAGRERFDAAVRKIANQRG